MTEPVSVIGIDPGIKNPGIVELVRYSHGWSAAAVPVLRSFDEMIDWLARRARNVEPWSLSLVGIEGVAAAMWGKAERGESSVHAAKIVSCRGAAKLFAVMMDVPCVELEPRTVKKLAIGNGNAKKEQVRRLIAQYVRQWPENANLNQSDAAAVALAAYRRTLPGALSR